jgi:DNA-binding NarL/FixJ family response regulator
MVGADNVEKLPVTVLLAEDHPKVRAAIRQILESDRHIQVVAEATNFTETLQLAADFEPQVILMDLHMPDEEDLEPAFVKAQLLLACQRILVMSFSIDDEAQALAQSYGATRLLDKMNLTLDLLPAVLSNRRSS